MAILATVGLSSSPAMGATAPLVQTNRTERWETNVIEVRMQATKLVTEYRTNWVNEVWNNIIDVYATNKVTKLYTNRIKIDLLQTNFVNAYHTNLKTLQMFHTNEVTHFLTNRISVEQLHTNLVQVFQTNIKTLHLTNFVSVLQFKTNWVNQPVTNEVSIDLPASVSSPSPKGQGGAPAVAAATLALQARRTGQPTKGKPAEVQITVHSTNSAGAPLHVQQWRVEREDGSMLLFGEDQEFRRALPVGKYKVEVKARQPGTNQMLAALGTLSVMPSDVSMQQKTMPKWVAP